MAKMLLVSVTVAGFWGKVDRKEQQLVIQACISHPRVVEPCILTPVYLPSLSPGGLFIYRAEMWGIIVSGGEQFRITGTGFY